MLVQSHSPSRLLAAFPLASRGFPDRLTAVLIFSIFLSPSASLPPPAHRFSYFHMLIFHSSSSFRILRSASRCWSTSREALYVTYIYIYIYIYICIRIARRAYFEHMKSSHPPTHPPLPTHRAPPYPLMPSLPLQAPLPTTGHPLSTRPLAPKALCLLPCAPLAFRPPLSPWPLRSSSPPLLAASVLLAPTSPIPPPGPIPPPPGQISGHS